MAKKNHGTTCPVCKREGLNLPGPKCHRCYQRIAKGLDPITGEPVAPETAPLAPAILADDEPASPITTVQATVGSPKIIGQLPHAGFTLDVMAAIDEAWLGKRTAIINQLQAAEKTSEKLRIAFFTQASVNAMGTEA